MKTYDSKYHRSLLIMLCIFALASCTGLPDKIQPVQGFDKARYLGTWYEIARLDHSFERGLEAVTATYTLRDDGGINVLNKGYNTEDGEWTQAQGKAYFVGDESVGHLKVSFFGPFYSSYVLAKLDQDKDKDYYDYALVTGFNTDYLWILAREPELNEDIQQALIDFAASKGFDTQALIFVRHELLNASD